MLIVIDFSVFPINSVSHALPGVGADALTQQVRTASRSPALSLNPNNNEYIPPHEAVI